MTRFEEVRDLIADQLGISVQEITPEARFVDLGADSMDMAYMLVDLEEVAGHEIPDDDFRKLFTVADVLNYLNDPRSIAS